jgi:MFS family permease
MWTRNFFLLCCANLALLLSMMLLLPTLPMYLLEIGGTQRDVGLAMSTYTIGSVFMRALAGWLSDRYGKRRIMVVGLVAMLAVSMLYLGAGNVLSVAAVRGLHGLAFGLASTAIGALVVDSLPVARMAEGVGYFGLSVPLANGIGPMIGLSIINGFGYPMLFIGVSSMLAITLLFSLPVRNIRPEIRVSRSPAPMLSNLFEKTALLPSVVMFFLSVVNGAVVYFMALYAADLHIANVGLFFAAHALCMAISRPLTGRWADRGGAHSVVFLGILCLLSGMIVTAVSHNMTGLLLAGALVGFGLGFSIPTLQALAVRNAPADRRGAATGTFYVAFDMGFGVGAIVWGLVAQGIGYRSMYLATVLPLLLAGAIHYRFIARPRPEPVRLQSS